MQAVLVMFRNDGEPRSFSVTRDITIIGRREDCDLRIPLGDVSRKHCRLVYDGETYRVEDLGSSNGTFLNGERIQDLVAVSAGDSIQLGPVVFVLQIDGVPADDQLQPVIAPPAAADAAAAAASAPTEEGVIPPIDEEGTMGPSMDGGVPTEDELDGIQASISDDDEDDDGFNAVLDELAQNQKTPRK